MIRSFIVLLLLVVVFLTGMLIGIDREQSAVTSDVQTGIEISETATHHVEQEIIEEKQTSPDEQLNNEQALNMDVPEQATQKMAFFLEAGVKGFYDVIVEVLYQISSLFI